MHGGALAQKSDQQLKNERLRVKVKYRSIYERFKRLKTVHNLMVIP